MYIYSNNFILFSLQSFSAFDRFLRFFIFVHFTYPSNLSLFIRGFVHFDRLFFFQVFLSLFQRYTSFFLYFIPFLLVPFFFKISSHLIDLFYFSLYSSILHRFAFVPSFSSLLHFVQIFNLFSR